MVVHPHKGIPLSVKKAPTVDTHCNTKNPQIIMPRERSQAKKENRPKDCIGMISRKANRSIVTESRSSVFQGWGWGHEEEEGITRKDIRNFGGRWIFSLS